MFRGDVQRGASPVEIERDEVFGDETDNVQWQHWAAVLPKGMHVSFNPSFDTQTYRKRSVFTGQVQLRLMAVLNG